MLSKNWCMKFTSKTNTFELTWFLKFSLLLSMSYLQNTVQLLRYHTRQSHLKQDQVNVRIVARCDHCWLTKFTAITVSLNHCSRGISCFTVSDLIEHLGRDLFHKLCISVHSLYHLLPPLRKCNRGHPCELPDLTPIICIKDPLLFEKCICISEFTYTWFYFYLLIYPSFSQLNTVAPQTYK